MSEVVFSEAPKSVIHIAEALIRQYHPWLQEANIAFVMRSEAQKRGNRMILGSTSKVPAKVQVLAEYDFLIWLSETDYEAMSDAQREALIDHELMHCKRSRDGLGWSLREHDVQEFTEIIQRHGLWTHDLRSMDAAIQAYKQGDLLAGAQVTLSGAGKVVTLTREQLERAAHAIGDD